MLTIFNKFSINTRLGEIFDLNLELRKIGLIRIVLGIVFFVRHSEILHTLSILGANEETVFLLKLFLVVILFFTVGFLTPIANLILLFFSIKMDIILGTFTLGTAILEITLLPLFLINAGQFYSIDRLIIQKDFKSLKGFRRLYGFIGARNKTDVKKAYLLSFLAYAIISFGALTLHIQDEYWINGITTKSLLINSYLSKEYLFFRSFNALFPSVFDFISASASVFQSVFQFLMIPLIFFRFGRFFVKYWGFLFYLISLFFINLSYLPHVELLLWLLIFNPIKTPSNTMAIFYDDHCNLCKRTMKFFKLINYNGRFEFLATSRNDVLLKRHNIELADAKMYMTGIKNEIKFKGIDLYYEVSKMNVLLWPLFPFLLLGKHSGIGAKMYNYIARRRYEVFGYCELSFEDEIAQASIPLQRTNSKYLTQLIFNVYLLLIITYPFLRIPPVNKALNVPAEVTAFSFQVYLHMGFDLPDVFNVVDLGMGDNWVQMYRIQNDEQVLVPLVGENGERMTYLNCDLLNFSNHNSDLFYFGTTLQLRRWLIYVRDEAFFKTHDIANLNFSRRIEYDFKVNDLSSKTHYLVKVFHKPTSDYLTIPINNRPKELIYEEDIYYDGEVLFRTLD